MLKQLVRIMLVFSLLLAPGLPALAQQGEIIASLERISGQVNVNQAESKSMVQGRKGLLLKTGDEVITGDDGRATIKFRDGSEIRLFKKTNFQIKAKESGGQDRTFKVNLLMKVGSFWGNMVKRRQVTDIQTPTATIGIKGTTLRVVEREGNARVALTEGLVEVSNARDRIDLQPGKRMTEFTRTDALADKVQDIPYKLNLTSEKKKLGFSNNRSEEVYVSIQLINIKTGEAVRRSGPIYLRSNYDRINYPQVAQLDERGFARVALTFDPPEASDSSLNGNVYVWGVMDSEESDDTSEGRILFTIPIPEGKERVRIESKTGKSKRVQ